MVLPLALARKSSCGNAWRQARLAARIAATVGAEDLSWPEAGALSLQPHPVALRALLRAVEAGMQGAMLKTVIARLKAAGAVEGDVESYCKVGRDEIAKGTLAPQAGCKK